MSCNLVIIYFLARIHLCDVLKIKAMSTYVYMVNQGSVTLWGLSSRERLERMLARAGDFSLVDDPANCPADTNLMLLHGDFLYDERIIRRLAVETDTLLQTTLRGKMVSLAAIVKPEYFEQARDCLLDESSETDTHGLTNVSLQEWSSGFQQQLRKFDPPYVLPVTEQDKHALEEHLYSGSYKGVTDLITKWAWPVPAKWVVRLCVRAGITPNAVTICSLILTIVAGVCFYQGLFAEGLVAGWLMTFLDTVDGKLARVTVTSTKMGHVLDHGLDIIHPPLWYIAWGLGLEQFAAPLAWITLESVFWLILAAYILGRICEGLFQLLIGKWGLFCWRPFDSFNRLITARRNPCMLLLSGSLLLGQAGTGLLLVLAWTLVSTLVIVLRFSYALVLHKLSSRPVKPWLAEIGKEIDRDSLAARIFTRPPLTSTFRIES